MEVEPEHQLVEVDRGVEHVPGTGAKGRQVLGRSHYASSEHDNRGCQSHGVQHPAGGVVSAGELGAEEDGVGVVRLGDVGGLARVGGGHDAKATPDQGVGQVLRLPCRQACEQDERLGAGAR